MDLSISHQICIIMHCHFADCARDFGPLHVFWLYSFERYNGLLGNQPTNNRSIELQLLKRFIRDNIHLDLLNTSDSMPLAADFADIVSMHGRKFQSTSETRMVEREHIFDLPKRYTLTVLSDYELKLLREAYCHVYPRLSAFTDKAIPRNLIIFCSLERSCLQQVKSMERCHMLLLCHYL